MPSTLKSRLPEIAAELRPKVSRAVKEGAEMVAATAKANAPIGSPLEGDSHPGALKAAIHVERRGGAEYAVVAGGQTADGTEVWYGHLIEYGHEIVSYERTEANPHGRKRVGSDRTVHGRQPPRPFLVPALEVHRLVIQKMIEAAIDG